MWGTLHTHIITPQDFGGQVRRTEASEVLSGKDSSRSGEPALSSSAQPTSTYFIILASLWRSHLRTACCFLQSLPTCHLCGHILPHPSRFLNESLKVTGIIRKTRYPSHSQKPT